jgi:hypothetical protein
VSRFLIEIGKRISIATMAFSSCFSLLLLCFALTIPNDAVAGTGDEPIVEIESDSPLERLFYQFSRGMMPDWDNEEEVRLFEMYRLARFGDPSVELPSNRYQAIQEFLKQHPKYVKPAFHEVHVAFPIFQYPPVSELESGKQLQSLYTSVQKGRSTLTDLLRANPTYAVRDGRLTQEEFETLFGKSPEKRDPENKREENLSALFEKLLALRMLRVEEEKPTKFIDETLLQIADTIGFEQAARLPVLQSKSSSAMEKLDALRNGIEYRQEFIAQKLGDTRTYESFLQMLEMENTPRALAPRETSKVFNAVSSELESKAVAVPGIESRIRPLSRAEAPLRSCLGGDCSSRTYFLTALERDFIYFTETNEKNHSSGHVTIVLGSVGKRKVAMVDKIQNFPNARIPYVLEAIRQSLAKSGYALAVPRNLGDHNGISNYAHTTESLRKTAAYSQQTEVLSGFKPHHARITRGGYTRAYDALDLVPLLPLVEEMPTGPHFRIGEKIGEFKTADFDPKTVFADILQLKHGNWNQKLQYVRALEALQESGLRIDPDYSSLSHSWLYSKATPVRVKNTLLRMMLRNISKLNEPESIGAFRRWVSLFHGLGEPEQRSLIQNLSQTKEWLALAKQTREIREHILPLYLYQDKEGFTSLMSAVGKRLGLKEDAVKKSLDPYFWGNSDPLGQEVLLLTLNTVSELSQKNTSDSVGQKELSPLESFWQPVLTGAAKGLQQKMDAARRFDADMAAGKVAHFDRHQRELDIGLRSDFVNDAHFVGLDNLVSAYSSKEVLEYLLTRNIAYMSGDGDYEKLFSLAAPLLAESSNRRVFMDWIRSKQAHSDRRVAWALAEISSHEPLPPDLIERATELNSVESLQRIFRNQSIPLSLQKKLLERALAGVDSARDVFVDLLESQRVAFSVRAKIGANLFHPNKERRSTASWILGLANGTQQVGRISKWLAEVSYLLGAADQEDYVRLWTLTDFAEHYRINPLVRAFIGARAYFSDNPGNEFEFFKVSANKSRIPTYVLNRAVQLGEKSVVLAVPPNKVPAATVKEVVRQLKRVKPLESIAFRSGFEKDIIEIADHLSAHGRTTPELAETVRHLTSKLREDQLRSFSKTYPALMNPQAAVDTGMVSRCIRAVSGLRARIVGARAQD